MERVNFVPFDTVMEVLDNRINELEKDLPKDGDLDKYQFEIYSGRNELNKIKNLLELRFK